MFSVELPFLRATLKASVASPPVETAPATISPIVEMQNGHIVVPSQVAKLNRLTISIEVTDKAGRFLQGG
jgi:hypothetical protein